MTPRMRAYEAPFHGWATICGRLRPWGTDRRAHVKRFAYKVPARGRLPCYHYPRLTMRRLRRRARPDAKEGGLTAMRNTRTLRRAGHGLTAPFLRPAGRLKLNTIFVMDNRRI